MTRTARLGRLMDILKDGETHTAEALAEALNVSVRTLYRDMATLAASGVAVEGHPGVGYRATARRTLPPVNLSDAELEALHLGLAVVGESGDPELAQAARNLSARLDTLVPEDSPPVEPGKALQVYPFGQNATGFRHMPTFRAAIRARQKLRLKINGGPAFTLRPLRLEYWGRIWTCLGWDEDKQDFHSFRPDEISEMQVLPGLFVDEPGKSLRDYEARVEGRYAAP